MKKILLLTIFASTLLYSCKKDKTVAGNMSFRVDGALVSTQVHNASYGSLLPAFLTTNITSSMHTDKRTVNININAVKPGTYDFVTSSNTVNKAYGFYYPDYFDFGGDAYAFTSGSFVVTELDTIARTFSGTFSGTATLTGGGTVSITDGVVTNGTLVRY
ncbi:MAG: hypothetical protein U0X41_06050 [Chitinophagales bacterium]|jgi:hypothetical protein